MGTTKNGFEHQPVVEEACLRSGAVVAGLWGPDTAIEDMFIGYQLAIMHASW